MCLNRDIHTHLYIYITHKIWCIFSGTLSVLALLPSPSLMPCRWLMDLAGQSGLNLKHYNQYSWLNQDGWRAWVWQCGSWKGERIRGSATGKLSFNLLIDNDHDEKASKVKTENVPGGRMGVCGAIGQALAFHRWDQVWRIRNQVSAWAALRPWELQLGCLGQWEGGDTDVEDWAARQENGWTHTVVFKMVNNMMKT